MPDNSMAELLKGLLGDDAEDKLKAVLGSISDGSANNILPDVSNNIETNSSKSVQSENNTDDYAGKMKSLLKEMSSQNDPRSNLLLSLRPYMSENRKKSIDSAVRLLNISKMSGLFR